MARALRIEFEGTLYHVMARGNARADIHLGWQESGLAFCLRLPWIVPVSRPLRLEFEDAVYHVTPRGDRREAIVRAYLDGGHTQMAIAKATDLSVSRISRLLAAHEAKSKT